MIYLQIYFTGPFWQLVKSQTHYLDQGFHIQGMLEGIEAAASCQDARRLLETSPTALQGFALPQDDQVDSVSLFDFNITLFIWLEELNGFFLIY